MAAGWGGQAKFSPPGGTPSPHRGKKTLVWRCLKLCNHKVQLIFLPILLHQWLLQRKMVHTILTLPFFTCFLFQGDEEIPFSERQRLVDLRNRQNRAHEELQLTEEAMLSTLAYLEEKYQSLLQTIQNNVNQCMGIMVALQENASNMRKSYIRADGIFSRYITTPPLPDNITYPTELEVISDAVFADELSITEIEEIEDEDEDDDASEDLA